MLISAKSALPLDAFSVKLPCGDAVGFMQCTAHHVMHKTSIVPGRNASSFSPLLPSPPLPLGFCLCVLITTLSDHLPGERRLERFRDTQSSIFKYFDKSLGRIEIVGECHSTWDRDQCSSTLHTTGQRESCEVCLCETMLCETALCVCAVCVSLGLQESVAMWSGCTLRSSPGGGSSGWSGRCRSPRRTFCRGWMCAARGRSWAPSSAFARTPFLR